MTGRPLSRLVARLHKAAAADGYPAADADLLRSFLRDRDPAAFDALVRRHGPAVLSACRKVLTDPADVEDAFQAAFLVLLRDAQGIRRDTAVGSWLYGVAHRVALRVRTARRRRDTVEARAEPRPPAAPPDVSSAEAYGVLHEELDRLPDRYRLPLMLCYLEGLSRDEAAVQLGVTLNMVRNRLERGREKLRARLTRRGVALSAGLLAATGETAVATVPSELLAAVAKTAARPTTRLTRLAAAGSSTVAGKIAGGLALTLGVALALGAVGAPPKDMPAKDAPKPAAEMKAAEPAKSVTFRGRVVGPAGQPVAGAKVWTVAQFGVSPKGPVGPRVVATTGPDGQFEGTDDGKGRRAGWATTAKLAATAPGLGVGWVEADEKPVEIRLAPDEPIKGRLLTLEGKPVEGAAVRVRSTWAPNGADLGPWLTELKAGKHPVYEIHNRHFDHVHKLYQDGYPVAGQPETVMTDRDGRFTLTGLGRDRRVELRIDGPTVATTEVEVFTRPDPTLRVPADPGEKLHGTRTYYGSTFDLAVEPTQPFEGVVTDRATGKPVAGVTVRARSNWWNMHTSTDRDGRYRLTGLPPGSHELIACPDVDQPYHRMMLSGGRDVSQKAVRLDFALTRGHWVTGKVVNVRTKKPEAGAPVWYFPFADEPAYESVPGSRAWSHEPTTYTAADGTFRVVAFACRGAVVANSFSATAISADQRPLQGDATSLEKGQADANSLSTSPVVNLTSYHAALIVNVDPNKPVEYTLTIDPGVTVTMNVVDPDAKPVTGTYVGGISTWELWSREQASAEAKVTQYNPDRPRPLVVLHPGRGLGKLVRPKAGDVGPWEVKLERTARATGRLVTDDGKAIADAPLQVYYLMPGQDAWTPSTVHDKVATDADGKFRLTNLVPGLSYMVRHARETGASRVRHFLNLKLAPGEEKALGDVKPTP